MTMVDLRGDQLHIQDDVNDQVEILVRPSDWEEIGWDPTTETWNMGSSLSGFLAPEPVIDGDGNPYLKLVWPSTVTGTPGKYYFAVWNDSGRTLLRRSFLVLNDRDADG